MQSLLTIFYNVSRSAELKVLLKELNILEIASSLKTINIIEIEILAHMLIANLARTGYDITIEDTKSIQFLKKFSTYL